MHAADWAAGVSGTPGGSSCERREAGPTILLQPYECSNTRLLYCWPPLQVLEYEQQYLAALPLPEMYEKSYMHRDTGGFTGSPVACLAIRPSAVSVCTALPSQAAAAHLLLPNARRPAPAAAASPLPLATSQRAQQRRPRRCPPRPPQQYALNACSTVVPNMCPWPAVTQVAVASQTEFFITGSADGHIKFWKKQPQGIEFAKHYKVGLVWLLIQVLKEGESIELGKSSRRHRGRPPPRAVLWMLIFAALRLTLFCSSSARPSDGARGWLWLSFQSTQQLLCSSSACPSQPLYCRRTWGR